MQSTVPQIVKSALPFTYPHPTPLLIKWQDTSHLLPAAWEPTSFPHTENCSFKDRPDEPRLPENSMPNQTLLTTCRLSHPVPEQSCRLRDKRSLWNLFKELF